MMSVSTTAAPRRRAPRRTSRSRRRGLRGAHRRGHRGVGRLEGGIVEVAEQLLVRGPVLGDGARDPRRVQVVTERDVLGGDVAAPRAASHRRGHRHPVGERAGVRLRVGLPHHDARDGHVPCEVVDVRVVGRGDAARVALAADLVEPLGELDAVLEAALVRVDRHQRGQLLLAELPVLGDAVALDDDEALGRTGCRIPRPARAAEARSPPCRRAGAPRHPTSPPAARRAPRRSPDTRPRPGAPRASRGSGRRAPARCRRPNSPSRSPRSSRACSCERSRGGRRSRRRTRSRCPHPRRTPGFRSCTPRGPAPGRRWR